MIGRQGKRLVSRPQSRRRLPERLMGEVRESDEGGRQALRPAVDGAQPSLRLFV